MEKLNKATKCHICFKGFQEDNPNVRDHCHYTGLYRGPAHRICNLRYKIPRCIPIVSDNLSEYDAHLIIRELGKKFDTCKIGVISENKEEYISFDTDVVIDTYEVGGEVKEKKIQLRFIDSIRFIVSSLDSLTNSLVKDGRKLNGFKDYSDEQYELLIRKGVYPYEYISSWDKFDETELPPKEAFYSELNMSDISNHDYSHAQRVWKGFDIKNFGEYHDLYLKTDVILLSNIFEAFRNTCLKHYGLDPAHFYMSSGLAWQAFLKKTGTELTDPDILLSFERGTRGGITQAVYRYAEASNKYMGDKFNPKEDSSYLQYLDGNNLYHWAMTQPLPTGGFNWVDPSEFMPDKIDSYMKGYLLEVDVKYPKELHDLHNDLLLMCDKMKANGVKKLVSTLSDKKNHVVHIKALNQALRHELMLRKVYRVIEFNQIKALTSCSTHKTDQQETDRQK